MRVMDFLLLWLLGRGQDRFLLLFGILAVYIPLWGERTGNEIERKKKDGTYENPQGSGETMYVNIFFGGQSLTSGGREIDEKRWAF
jgi:hypothetical protein